MLLKYESCELTAVFNRLILEELFDLQLPSGVLFVGNMHMYENC